MFSSSYPPVSTLVIAVEQEVTKDTREERWFNTTFCLLLLLEELDLTNIDLILRTCFTLHTTSQKQAAQM